MIVEEDIDFDKLLVPDDRDIKVAPVLSIITIGKPSKRVFFRVRDGKGWEPEIMYLYVPEGSPQDTQPYLVYPAAQKLLEEMGLLIPAKFYFYIQYGSNLLKVDYIPQKLNQYGVLSRYHSSRMEAYEVAKTRWIRLQANTSGGYYSYAVAEDQLDEPRWPDSPGTLRQALNIVFRGFVIRDLDHPEIKNLRGKK